MSDCPHGCQDGWHYSRDDDGDELVRPCECQRRRPSEFRDRHYRPGGRNARARFIRRQSRRGTLGAATVKIRNPKGRRIRRRPHATREQQARWRALKIGRACKQLPQLSREKFAELYAVTCEREGWPLDARGLNTAWELYAALWTRYRVQGQDFEFTNAQAQVALEHRGRGRCRRTVQLTRQRLVAMGVFDFQWVKRGTWSPASGWAPGSKKDTVRATALVLPRSAPVEPVVREVRDPAERPLVDRHANCTLPSVRKGLDIPVSASCATAAPTPPPPDAEPPAPAPPGPAEPPGEDRTAKRHAEREELERALRFQQLKIETLASERARFELLRLQAELRALDRAQEGDERASP